METKRFVLVVALLLSSPVIAMQHQKITTLDIYKNLELRPAFKNEVDMKAILEDFSEDLESFVDSTKSKLNNKFRLVKIKKENNKIIKYFSGHKSIDDKRSRSFKDEFQEMVIKRIKEHDERELFKKKIYIGAGITATTIIGGTIIYQNKDRILSNKEYIIEKTKNFTKSTINIVGDGFEIYSKGGDLIQDVKHAKELGSDFLKNKYDFVTDKDKMLDAGVTGLHIYQNTVKVREAAEDILKNTEGPRAFIAETTKEIYKDPKIVIEKVKSMRGSCPSCVIL